MKYRDLEKGKMFTWWNKDRHLTGVKLDRSAFCLSTLELVEIHPNKDVKDPENIPEGMELRIARDGRSLLCSPMEDGKLLARRIVLTGGEIIHEESLKPIQKRTRDGRPGQAPDQAEFYVVFQMMGRKFQEIKTLVNTLNIMLSDNADTGHNDIMRLPQGRGLKTVENRGRSIFFDSFVSDNQD